MNKDANLDSSIFFDIVENFELEEIFDIAFPHPNMLITPTSTLIPFIETALTNLGWLRKDLAEHSNININIIDEILDNPEQIAKVDKNILDEIANTIGYDPDVFELFLSYEQSKPIPNQYHLADRLVNLGLSEVINFTDPASLKKQSEELNHLQEELLQLLVNGLEQQITFLNENLITDTKYKNFVDQIRVTLIEYQERIDSAKNDIFEIKSDFRKEVRNIEKSMTQIIKQVRAAKAMDELVQGKLPDTDTLIIIEHEQNKKL